MFNLESFIVNSPTSQLILAPFLASIYFISISPAPHVKSRYSTNRFSIFVSPTPNDKFAFSKTNSIGIYTFIIESFLQKNFALPDDVIFKVSFSTLQEKDSGTFSPITLNSFPGIISIFSIPDLIFIFLI